MTRPRYKPQKILWLDLEMTGLDPEADKILELGAIVTDWDFNELGVYSAVQKVNEELLKQRMVGGFWEENPKARDGLILQNSTGDTPKITEEKFIAFLSEHFTNEEKILLAGNSIHNDRKFIDKEWQILSKKLHYRMLDVSSFKCVFESRYNAFFVKPEEHRAIEDIRGSIDELKYYLRKVKK